jgi:hypothetical protein
LVKHDYILFASDSASPKIFFLSEIKKIYSFLNYLLIIQEQSAPPFKIHEAPN